MPPIPRLSTAICALSLALTLCPAAAQGQSAAPSAPASAEAGRPDKAALEQYLRYLNLWNKDVTVTLSDPVPSASLPGFLDLKVTASVPGASLTQDYYVSPDGARIVRARANDRLGKTVFETSQYPFQAEQEALDLKGRPTMGPEGAPITLTVFSDFQCAYCRDEAKLLRANLPTAYPDAVRMVFVDFPLIQIHDWAKPAAMAGRCLMADGNDRFWKYHDWVFESQKEITAANFAGKLQEWAQAQGADALRLQQCMQSPETDAAVMASFQKALSMGLNSTPTIFVNGRQLGGKLEWPTLSQVIEAELDYLRNPPATTKSSAANKEECCTVELPGLFPK